MKRFPKRLLYGLLLFVLLFSSCYATEADIPIAFSDQFSLSNANQSRVGFYFGVDKQTLYRFGFAVGEKPRALCALRGSSFYAVEMEDYGVFHNYIPIGFSGEVFYFWNDERALCGYSLREKTAVRLIESKGDEYTPTITFFSADGALCVTFPDNPERTAYRIMNGSVSEEEAVWDSYQLGDRDYILEHHRFQAATLYERRGEEINEIILPYAENRYLLPVEDGILICNEGGEHLLYFINSAGEITELFSLPCFLSDSAIAVRGDEVYLSIERWEKSGQLGALHYKNDQLQGCYRINWRTQEVKHLSDAIYDGLFVLDNQFILGCSQRGPMVWLDYNFQVVQTLYG